MVGSLLLGLLVGAAVLVGFIGLWRLAGKDDPVGKRLEEYGTSTADVGMADETEFAGKRRRWSGANRLLARFGLGPRLADQLDRADLPMTAVEYTLIMLGTGVLGFLIASWRVSPLLGLVVAVPSAYLPMIYLRYRISRRQRAFTDQLPDTLTLLVGGLRAGYGLAQALGTLVDQMSPPASVEFGRVIRSVSLGTPIHHALAELSDRIGTDDADLVVTAISVQYEMGGNLAQTLDIIGETVRDRIRMLAEIRVLTAQQRMTGYILAVMPAAVGVGMYMINSEYIMRLFEPGWIRLLPIAAVVMMIFGFIVIRKIVDIEV
jgi:tight adherence protein B